MAITKAMVKKRTFREWNNLLHKYITVEPVMFLYMFAGSIMTPTTQAIIYRKICMDKFNETVCDALKDYKEAEDLVQTDASYWTMLNSLCNTIPAIFSAQIMGAWSDKFGRRIVMAAPFFGQGIAAAGYLVNSVYMEAPVGFVLIGMFFGSILGSFGTTLMAIYSYLGSVVEKKDRTLRTAIVNAMMMLSRSIAAAVSGILLDNFGFIATFSTSIGVYGLGVVYIALWLRSVEEQHKAEECGPPALKPGSCYKVPNGVLKENVDGLQKNNLPVVYIIDKDAEAQKDKPTKKMGCNALFNMDTFTGSFRCFAKKRPDNRRFHLLLQLFALVVSVLSFGSFGLQYLFLKRRPLSWSQTMYGYFSSASSIVKFICLLGILPILKKVFNMPDTILSLIGITSFLLSMVVLSVATETWMAFLSTIIGVMGSVLFTCLRSMMSCMVEPHEQGVMFALIASLQSVASVIAQPLFNTIYPATLNWFPGFVFFLAAVMQLIPMSLIIVLHFQLRKYPVKGFMQSERKEENLQHYEVEKVQDIDCTQI